MLNLLNSFWDYLAKNIVLVIVLAIIVLLIIGLVIAMIVIAAKAKKKQKAAENGQTPVQASAPDKEPAPAPAEEPAKKEESAPAPVQESKKEEPEKKPAKKEESAKKEPAKASAVSGKWIIRKQDDKYAFDLVASNGEVMISSSVPYAALASAKTGIQTYKNNIEKGNFSITETKNGDFIFQLLNARGALLANGNAYRTKANCENAIESTKRWATSDTIEVHD